MNHLLRLEPEACGISLVLETHVTVLILPVCLWIVNTVGIFKPPTPLAFTVYLAPFYAFSHYAVGVHVYVETEFFLVATVFRYV